MYRRLTDPYFDVISQKPYFRIKNNDQEIICTFYQNKKCVAYLKKKSVTWVISCTHLKLHSTRVYVFLYLFGM